MTDETFTKQTWVYMGRRQAQKSGLLTHWLDHTGEIRAYGKNIKGNVIGGNYEVLCSVTDEGVTVRGAPVFQSAPDDTDQREAQVRMWELEDRAAYTAEQVRSRERKAAGEDHMGDLTLREVRDRMTRQFGAGRTALLAQILRYIGA